MDFVLSLPSLVARNLLGNLDLVVMFGAFYLMSHLVKLKSARQGLDPDSVADLSFWVAVGAVVGGRLGYALPMTQSYLAHPVDLVRINSGMYLYGALAGGLISGAWIARRRTLSFWSIADMYGLYAPLAIAVTRFGCLLGNTCYGTKASSPLGIVFPGLTQPRYPSELYEGLFGLLIFGVLLWLSQRRPQPGTLFLAFITGYALTRALVDLTRINFGSQWGAADPILSVAIAAAGAVALWLRGRSAEGQQISVRRQASEDTGRV